MTSHFENAPFFSLDEFEDVLFEAARTISRLPAAGPRGHATGWPDWVRDANLAYGYNEEPVRLGPPAAREIDRLDKVIGCLWAADPADARVCMAVAFSAQKHGWPRSRGPQWKRVSDGMGIAPDTLKTRFKAATERLWRAGVVRGPLNRK
jgi:hypothetical protein